MLAKNKFFAALFVVTMTPLFSFATPCEDILAKIKAMPRLRAEFNAEFSDVTRAYSKASKLLASDVADSFNFKERVVAIQNLILQQDLKEFNGMKVNRIALNDNGHPKSYKISQLMGEDTLFGSFTNHFTETRMVQLSSGKNHIFISTGIGYGDVIEAVEMIVVNNAGKQFPDRFTFGARHRGRMDRDFHDEDMAELDKMSQDFAANSAARAKNDSTSNEPPDWLMNMSEETKATLRDLLARAKEPKAKPEPLDVNAPLKIFTEKQIGIGTVGSARVIEQVLGQLEANPPQIGASAAPLAKWEKFNNQFLQLAGQIRLRTMIKKIVALHKQQQILRKDRRLRSEFYYDDRAHLNVGQSFKVPGGKMTARPGGQLLSILGYVEIRMVLDIPRDTDNSVRLHIWDARNQDWAEEYVLPLNLKAKDIGVKSKASTFLPIVYGRLVETIEQMDMRREELQKGER